MKNLNIIIGEKGESKSEDKTHELVDAMHSEIKAFNKFEDINNFKTNMKFIFISTEDPTIKKKDIDFNGWSSSELDKVKFYFGKNKSKECFDVMHKVLENNDAMFFIDNIGELGIKTEELLEFLYEYPNDLTDYKRDCPMIVCTL